MHVKYASIKKEAKEIRMGNTCNSMADSCQCMTKPTQYCKVISLQLIKINEKKKGKREKENTNNTPGGID